MARRVERERRSEEKGRGRGGVKKGLGEERSKEKS